MQESWLPQAQNIEVWAVYFGIAVIAIWEYFAPRRELSRSLRLRWLSNIGLFIVNTVLSRIIGPTLAIAFAFEVQQKGWGLFNVIELPSWITFTVSLLFMDFCFYLSHRAAHAVPWLWRFHRVHHSDGDIDITTSLRFHPLEVVYQNGLQLLAVLVIGAPPLAIAAYLIVFMALSRFQHGNVYLPEYINRALNLFVVTADMHRIHHSARQAETDSNFGGVLPWHDRLLGTYVAEPLGGQLGMQVGLHEYSEDKHLTLGWMLVNPFLPTRPIAATAAPGDKPTSDSSALSSA